MDGKCVNLLVMFRDKRLSLFDMGMVVVGLDYGRFKCLEMCDILVGFPFLKNILAGLFGRTTETFSVIVGQKPG